MEEKQLQLIQYAQAGDDSAREKLIQEYLTFVRQVASQYCQRLLEWENDDELSVALMAFDEAVSGFDADAGKKFENYVRMVVRSRLVDYYRTEDRHQGQLSLEQDSGDPFDLKQEGNGSGEAQGRTDLGAQAAWEKYKETREAAARREEMEQFQEALAAFHLSLDKLEETAPKHQKTRDRLVEVAKTLAENEALRRYFTHYQKLPLKELALTTGVNRKAIKRGREYIMGVCLILIDDRFNYLRSLFSLESDASPSSKSGNDKSGKSGRRATTPEVNHPGGKDK